MHPVLCIDEILSLIFFQLREITQDQCLGTLAAAARTCQTFKEPALDCLWYNLPTLAPLAHILPKGVYRNMKNGSVVFERPMTAEELPSILKYTRRSRRLSLVSCQHMPFMQNVLLAHPRLFPNVERLKMKEGSIDTLLHIRSLLGVPLTEISFSRVHMDRDLDRCEDIVEAFCDKLTTNSSRLRSLEFVLADGGVDYGEIESHIIDTIKRSPELTTVHVSPQNPRLIRALGQLPQLKTLRLDIRESPRSPVEDNPMFVDGELLQTPFPALENLIINCECRMSTASRILAGQGLFSQKHIKITGDYFCEESDVLSLMQAVVHPAKSAPLETFRLNFDDVGDVPHIRFARALSPLLDLHELRDVSVGIPVPVAVDNTDLKSIADAWPNLTHLSFDTGDADMTHIAYHPEADLGGVAELSRCRFLQRLKLFFRAESVRLTSSTLALPPCAALERLSVGSSPIKSTTFVARLLRERFPKLSKITHDSTAREGPASSAQRDYSQTPRRWKEVEKMIKGSRTVHRAASVPL